MWLYCYGENMNIMAFRGGLENYMAVMLLSFNRIFRFFFYNIPGWEIYRVNHLHLDCLGLLLTEMRRGVSETLLDRGPGSWGRLMSGCA